MKAATRSLSLSSVACRRQLQGPRGQAAAQLGVGRRAAHRRQPAPRRRRGGTSSPALAVAERLADAADVGGDDREARAHRLLEDPRDALGQGDVDEGVGVAVERRAARPKGTKPGSSRRPRPRRPRRASRSSSASGPSPAQVSRVAAGSAALELGQRPRPPAAGSSPARSGRRSAAAPAPAQSPGAAARRELRRGRAGSRASRARWAAAPRSARAISGPDHRRAGLRRAEQRGRRGRAARAGPAAAPRRGWAGGCGSSAASPGGSAAPIRGGASRQRAADQRARADGRPRPRRRRARRARATCAASSPGSAASTSPDAPQARVVGQPRAARPRRAARTASAASSLAGAGDQREAVEALADGAGEAHEAEQLVAAETRSASAPSLRKARVDEEPEPADRPPSRLAHRASARRSFSSASSTSASPMISGGSSRSVFGPGAFTIKPVDEQPGGRPRPRRPRRRAAPRASGRGRGPRRPRPGSPRARRAAGPQLADSAQQAGSLDHLDGGRRRDQRPAGEGGAVVAGLQHLAQLPATATQAPTGSPPPSALAVVITSGRRPAARMPRATRFRPIPAWISSKTQQGPGLVAGLARGRDRLPRPITCIPLRPGSAQASPRRCACPPPHAGRRDRRGVRDEARQVGREGLWFDAIPGVAESAPMVRP